MAEFKRLKFGLVPIGFIQPHINDAEKTFISYLKSCGGTDIQYDVNVTTEIFKLAHKYVGSNFKNWLIANFSNGSGARASLCKAILNWSNGEVSSKAVTSEINRDFSRIDFLNSYQEQLEVPYIYKKDGQLNTNVSFDKITDRNFYEFLALIGPELTAHFCLSLNGVRFKTE